MGEEAARAQGRDSPDTAGSQQIRVLLQISVWPQKSISVPHECSLGVSSAPQATAAASKTLACKGVVASGDCAGRRKG